jgi:hypothetical protein
MNIFLPALITYIVVEGSDSRVNETIAWGALMLLGAVNLGYLGFAVKDDANVLNSFKR